MLKQPIRTDMSAVSYLDIPDLVSLSRISPILATLAADPLLHRTRIFVINPSRLNHLLFGRSAEGILFRPTAIDLSQRNVLRGLGLERRFRAGIYFYSQRVSDLLRTSLQTCSLKPDGNVIRECNPLTACTREQRYCIVPQEEIYNISSSPLLYPGCA